ncbi:hypothetical protein DL96DRAFT_1818154 [Flagelloscypha sp. PMI_526]|nr:hypothetical protein DL96DRAFT_1818154 [Flagelloscypha sp. PMI_526]
MSSLPSADFFPDILRLLPQADILACLTVNSVMHTLATPVLWSSVTFGGRSSLEQRWTCTANTFLNERNHRNWKHVRELNIRKVKTQEGVLERLSSFLEIAENISSLQFFGASGTASPRAIEPWRAIGDDMMELILSSKLLASIVQLSFHKLRFIPLPLFLERCSCLRVLHLKGYGPFREVVSDEIWPGIQLETLTFGPCGHLARSSSNSGLAMLLHLGRNEASINTLHYSPPYWARADHGFLATLHTLLGAAPNAFSSLRHLSINHGIWTYIVIEDEFSPNPKLLLPLSSLPSLQNLTMAFSSAVVFREAGDTSMNHFYRWFCRHFHESSLPPSFTQVTTLLEVDHHVIYRELDAAPLPSDITNVLISSHVHFTFILDTTSLPPETSNAQICRCSEALKSWGKDLFQAGKMDFLWR